MPPYHLPNDTPVSVCSKPSTTELLERFVLLKDETCLKDASSTPWAVCHTCSQSSPLYQDTSVVLPIFCNDYKSAATIRYLLDILIKYIHYLNQSQTAVIGFDQLLYAWAKTIQRFQPTTYGQQKLASMLGALHIEMGMLSCLGDCINFISFADQ